MERDIRKYLILAVVFFLLLLECSAPGATSQFHIDNAYQPSGMSSAFNIGGYEPAEAGSYPVFVWVTGTWMDYWNGDDRNFTREMAERGFVAVSVEYDNGWDTGGYPGICNSMLAKARHIFDITDPGSAISRICDLPNADCDFGIVTSGFSQGANLASLAKNYDDRVEASFLIGNGYTGGVKSCIQDSGTVITGDRIRSIVGKSDTAFGASPDSGVRTQQELTTGISCGSGAYDCIQPDGSGWYMVQAFETADGDEDHCFYYSGTCGYAFDTNFEYGTAVWSLEPSLDWLARFGYCPVGDLDGDCWVSISDLEIFAQGWLSSDIVADIDGSGTVDYLDFSKIAEEWDP